MVTQLTLMWFIHWRSGRPASAAIYTLNMRSTINVFFTFYMANFATNFLGYITFWTAFRKKVADILCLKYCRNRRNQFQIIGSSTKTTKISSTSPAWRQIHKYNKSSSDEFNVGYCPIKVKVTTRLLNFSSFTTIQTVKFYISALA